MSVRGDLGRRHSGRWRLFGVVVLGGLVMAGGCAPHSDRGQTAPPPALPAETVAPNVAQGGLPPGIRAAAGEAYFEMETILGDRFVFKLVDAARIRQARDILDRKLPKRVSGRIIPRPQAYNRPWHFHLDPATIEFSYLTDDRCDAAIHYVEDHLAEIGEGVLPQQRWCPLSSRLTRELLPAQ